MIQNALTTYATQIESLLNIDETINEILERVEACEAEMQKTKPVTNTTKGWTLFWLCLLRKLVESRN